MQVWVGQNLWKLNKVFKKSFRSDFCPFVRKWCCYSCLLSQVLYIYDAMQFCETVKNITRFSPSIYHYNRMCTRSEQFLRPLPMGYIWQTSQGCWLMLKNCTMKSWKMDKNIRKRNQSKNYLPINTTKLQMNCVTM